MNLPSLTSRTDLDDKSKLAFDKFSALITALNAKSSQAELPQSVVESVTNEVGQINALNESDCNASVISKAMSRVIKIVRSDMGLSTPGYFRALWMVLGMTCFGLPIGVAFGASQGNPGLMAIGLPIGMMVGMILGGSMDAKAKKEGKQLEI